MKYTNLFLLIALFISSLQATIPTEAPTLNQEKKSFTAQVKEFLKCVKGDKGCDPKKIRNARIGLAITGALLIAGITTRVYWPKKPVININESLARAVEKGNLEEVKRLLPLKGIDLNYMAYYLTPLTNAASRGRTDIVAALLDGGADINKKDDSFSAILHASMYGHEETVNLLLKRGAKLDPQSTGRIRASGKTILHEAYKPTIIEALIKHGANVNETAYKQITPLMDAAENGNLEKVKVLINHGADINAQDNQQQTALDKAKTALENLGSWNKEKEPKYKEIIKLLEKDIK